MGHRYLFALIIVLLAGCAAPAPVVKPDRVVLLPGRDGQTGAIIVKTAHSQALLEKPYGAADISKNGQMETKDLQPAEVEQQFGTVLAARPLRPVSFTLYFIGGKDELTPESKLTLESMRTELAKRPAPEVTVIGHTDKVGTDAQNDVLSLKRAEAVRQALIKAGMAGDQIDAAGRGKREPLVPTAEGVAEPKNRRVEISVR